jgi:hypothetical protein
MADQTTELRRINWSECFPFTQIFRTFKMTISPGKMALAMAALILTALSGGILDALWSSRCQPLEDEVNAYWQVSGIDAWRDKTRESQVTILRSAYQSMAKPLPQNVAADLVSEPNKVIDKAREQLREYYDATVRGLGDTKEDRQKIAAAARGVIEVQRDLESLRPKGVFSSFRSFETAAVRQMLDAARGLNFMGQFHAVVNSRAGGLEPLGTPSSGGDAAIPSAANDELKKLLGAQAMALAGKSGEADAGTLLPVPSVKTGPKGIGVIPSVLLMLRGVQWLFAEHWFFAILFLLDALIIWSLFGGAICRMAALSFTRDERIGLKSAVAFSTRKLLGFITAPLLPVGLVVAIGFLIFVGGLVMAIPGFGGLVGGLTTGLALVGGFVMSLVILGAVGGFGLMWPTIAVEGSDSFDAMSRSYSYLFSRPWKAAFFAVVATVYGSLCYLFVRVFVLIMLKSTRFFVGLGLSGTSRPGAGSAGASRLDAIWPHPSFESLCSFPSRFGWIHWDDGAGAGLVYFWVMLVVALTCAFLASFFFCGSTIVYCLLRREVDATALEEVFVEEDLSSDVTGATSAPAPEVSAPSPQPDAG